MKNRNFALADTTKVEKHREIVEEFMRRIFELEPDDYLITDESILSDFAEGGKTDELPAKIYDVFGVDVTGIKFLAEIFEKISTKREN